MAALASPLCRLVLPLGVGLAGCSLPTGRGHHLTVGYARTSAASNQVQTAVPGLDVRLGTGHDGINLGWSSLVVAHATTNGVPVVPATNSPTAWRYEPPLGWVREQAGETRHLGWFLWRRPPQPTQGCRFIAEGHAGLALGLSRHLKGLELGFGRQTWLVTPTNSHGTWTLSFQSGANGVTRLEEQTTHQNKPE